MSSSSAKLPKSITEKPTKIKHLLRNQTSESIFYIQNVTMQRIINQNYFNQNCSRKDFLNLFLVTII